VLKFAISSWSVDGLLNSGFPLLDLPPALKTQGIAVLELCHFHLPSTEPAYLETLRSRLEASGVELFSMLIDTGDVASPEPKALTEGLETIRHYMDVAAALGAERVRISAGQQPATPDVLAQSAAQLTALTAYAAERGVKVSTENWQQTAQHPEDVLAILEVAPESLGLCADTGNAEATRDKYETLQLLLPHATSVHFKARMDGESIDQDDVSRCLALMNAASFAGPVSLIYDRKENEWSGIGALKHALYEAAQAGVAN
jgi:sugar phosphate isomerase/epimerase